jgi:23S rRNA pseudouridine2605 synthase
VDGRVTPGHDDGKVMAGPDKHERNSGERIAKRIARAGLCSRREAEAWIAAGRVAVNGTVVASPALNVGVRDRITVDGQALPARERTRLVLYHKPRGLVTTHADPQGRPTIFQKLPQDLPRLISVGRLDLNSEGLLLLTNDGGLARVLERPETGWLRRYRVRAHGRVDQAALDGLREGITIDGIRYGPIEASLDREQGANVWLTFAMREGKNREVRNVLGHLGLSVNRLIRVSFGPFQLGDLAEGAVEEVPTRVLREQLGARVAAQAGADFAGPVNVAHAAGKQPASRTPLPTRSEAERWGGVRGGGHIRSRRTTQEPPTPAPSALSLPPARKGSRGESNKGRGRRSDREAQPATESRHQKKPRSKPRSGHAWREREPWGERKPPLKRKYRGQRREDSHAQSEQPAEKRAGLVKDRKGRRVLVERFATQTPQLHAQPERPAHQARPQKRHRGPPRDRASGPRPSRPRGR